VAKTRVVCIEFFPDVARQKLLKFASVYRNYSKNKSGTFFMDHDVVLFCSHSMYALITKGYTKAKIRLMLTFPGQEKLVCQFSILG